MLEALKLRYDGQIAELHAEMFRAKVFLKEIEGANTGAAGRVIEVVVAAKEASLTEHIDALVKELGDESMRVLERERAEAANLEALS